MSVALPVLHAADVTWTSGTSDGLWATGASWQGGLAPTTSDSVFFGATTGTRSLTYNIANTAPAWGGITFASGASAYTISGGTMTMAGGTAAITNSSTNAQIINSVFASGFTVAGSGSVTLGGTILSGNITKTGTGVLTLSAANTYSGATRVSNGVLAYGASASSANSDLTIGAAGVANAPTALTIADTGGTRTISKSLTFDGAYASSSAFYSGQQLTVTVTGSVNSVLNFGDLTLQDGLAHLTSATNTAINQQWNFGRLTINNGGMVYLQRVSNVPLGVNTGTNRLNVIFATAPALTGTGAAGTSSVGIVVGAAAGASGPNFVTYDANGLRLLAGGESTPLVSGMTAGRNATVASNTTATLTANTSVNSLRLLNGNPSIALGGNALTVTSGMVANFQANAGGTATIGSTVDDGTLQFNSANGYVISDSKSIFVINSRIDGTGGLTFAAANSGANTAVIHLAGANTVSGETRIVANYSTVVRLMNSLALQNLTLDYNNYGGTFSFGSTTDSSITGFTFGGLRGNQSIALTTATNALAVTLAVGSNGESTTYGGVLSGAGGSLTKTGTGALTLTGSNTYTGATTISGGTLQIGIGGTTGALATSSAITNNGTLVFNRSNSLTQGTHFSSAAISGTGSLIQAGAGSLTLNAANTYSGQTRVAAGSLSIANASALQNSTLDMNGDDSGTISFSQNSTLGGLTGSRNLDMGTRTLSIGNNGLSTTFSGVLSNGALTKTGAGTLTLTGNNTYSGLTTISGGTLAVGNGGTSGALAGNVLNNAALVFNRSDATTFANGISGSGLVRLLNGSLTLSGSSSFSGGTLIDGGTLLVNGSLASGVAAAANTMLGGSGVIGGPLSGAGLVSPGNSPGILTATVFDPTGGLDAAFEFTAFAPNYGVSGTGALNDVLRLTSGSPFSGGDLTNANTIDIYFNVDSIVNGDIFEGGFFTGLSAADLLTDVQGATFRYWIKDNGGSTPFGGVNYSSLTSLPGITGITVNAVSRTADFGGGNVVAGSVTQFIVVPEPGAIALAGVGVAIAGWMLRKRRRGAEMPRNPHNP